MTPQESHPALAWDDVRRVADEIRLQLHLGGMEARARWRRLEPSVAGIERSIANSGQRASAAIDARMHALADALRRLRADLDK